MGGDRHHSRAWAASVLSRKCTKTGLGDLRRRNGYIHLEDPRRLSEGDGTYIFIYLFFA